MATKAKKASGRAAKAEPKAPAELGERGPSIHQLDPERIQQALAMASIGLGYRQIAAALGVQEDTLRHWIRRANEPLERPHDAEAYIALRDKIELTWARFAAELAKAAVLGARGGRDLPDPSKTKPDPRLADEILKHHKLTKPMWAPEPKQQIELSGAGGGGMQIFFPKLDGDSTPDGRNSQ